MDKQNIEQKRSIWDEPFLERCPPARKELAERQRPATNREHLAQMGDADFDADAYIASETGRQVAELIESYPAAQSDDNPAADAYWEARGYRREYHPAADPALAWVSVCPRETPPGVLYPMVVLDHGGRDQSLASEMENSGFIHEIIKRDAAVFVLPANTATDNVIHVCGEAERLLPVDRSREYIIGFSGGGAWARHTALTHPERFAAYAPCGSNMMSWPALIDDAAVEHVRQVGLPVCLYAGRNEFLKIFPLYAPGTKFTGILGKDVQPGTPEEKYMLLRRCLYAAGCPDVSPEECFATAKDADLARSMSGVPGGKASLVRCCGRDHAIIDYTGADGRPAMRVICVEGIPHVPAPSACAMVWDFLRQFRRS